VIELLLQAERALTMGMVDQAERLYLQAVAVDPQNSIAVVGLARVALERADDEGALREARRALAIDPENVAAARLAERLEEVLAYRARALRVSMTAPDTTDPEPEPEAAEPPEPEAPARGVVDRLFRRNDP
jgi:tetratricopeptide (TPR) repeat protein